MTGIGLLLIDMRRRRIDDTRAIVVRAEYAVRTAIAGGSGHHHEVAVAAFNVKRIVLGQRHDDEAITALVHKVEAMIEKLAEKSHVGVGRRGEALIRCRIRDQVRALLRAEAKFRADDLAAFFIGGMGCGGVRRRLVHDQITDQTRAGILNRSAISIHVGGISSRNVIFRKRENGQLFTAPENRLDEFEKFLVGRTEAFIADAEVITGTVDRTQAPGHMCIRQDFKQSLAASPGFRVILRKFDLLENKVEIDTRVR